MAAVPEVGPRSLRKLVPKMPTSVSPRSVLAAFDQVEADLIDFVGRVPLSVEHLAVWSPILVRCIVEACSQLDSLWKLRAGPGGNVTITDHHARHACSIANEWLVVWEGDGFEVGPFRSWSQATQYVPLSWWQVYNNLKHNRWEYVREATVKNAVDAAGALFLAIARDPDCGAVLAERGWIHSTYATDYILARLYSHPASVLGVTVESRLFSHAIGSSLADFAKMLAYYNRCSRRFGKWLEMKYDREFWIG